MFRFLARGYPEDLVLVSGWGFDNRIFNSVDLPFNYILYEGKDVSSLAVDLGKWLRREGKQTTTLLGWSMGAYVVSEFAMANPENTRGVLLVGARSYYPEAEVIIVRQALRRNRKGFLRKFYKDCFAGHDRALYRRFKEELQPCYLTQWTVAGLERELDWISSQSLRLDALDKITNVILVQGQADRLVRSEESNELCAQVKQGRAISLLDTGHLPFLANNFQSSLHTNA